MATGEILLRRGTSACNVPDMDPAKILHVDDEPLASALLGAWMRHQGWLVDSAAGPGEADRLLGRGTYDVVVSDIHMPGNHHLEWVEALLRGGGPPVVLLTGNPQLVTAQRAANLPVAAYLTKPPDYAELRALLDRLIAQERHRRTLKALADELQARTGAAADATAVALGQLFDRLSCWSECYDRSRGGDGRDPIPTAVHARWREAVAETIGVIERTKHSFRSKELGQLRRRLEDLLRTAPPDPRPTPAEEPGGAPPDPVERGSAVQPLGRSGDAG